MTDMPRHRVQLHSDQLFGTNTREPVLRNPANSPVRCSSVQAVHVPELTLGRIRF